jgi:hypothetical protein
MREYYKIAFLYKGKHLYALWYTNDVDGILNANGKIKYFNGEPELIDYCKEKGISIEYDIAIYDIDKIDEIISSGGINIDCKYMLDLWNITGDIAKTMNVPFYGNEKEMTDIYNKILLGNNLLPIRKDRDMYLPEWNKEEITSILKLIKECRGIFELSVPCADYVPIMV